MLFCKEPTCKSLAVVGGYCLSHQLDRANELYSQLNQRSDSCTRMSLEITERIGREARLTNRAEAAEREAAELRAERDAARNNALAMIAKCNLAEDRISELEQTLNDLIVNSELE